MAIDIYLGEDQVLSLDHCTFALFERAHDRLEKKTGLAIDPYGTTMLSASHGAIFAEGLRELRGGLAKQPTASRACADLLALLERATRAKETLRFEGD